MTGATRRAPHSVRRVAAAGIAALAVLASSVLSGSPVAADPVLDDVPVEQTPAIRGARGELDDAVRAQADATEAWVVADQQRLAVVAEVGAADVAVAGAGQALTEARAEVDRRRAELERLEAEEQRRLDALERSKVRLRETAAAVYSTGPDDDDRRALGTFDQMTVGERRDHVRGRVVEVDAATVDRREEAWRAARDASDDQRDEVRRAQDGADEAADRLASAEADREERLGRLREAEQEAGDRRADLDQAGLRRFGATLALRDARLVADVEGLDLPLVALHAYWRASAVAPCEVPWWLVAGIGRVESGHGSAQGAEVGPDGKTSKPIRGIALDGGPNVAAIGDTDGGLLDGDTVWDRAVGPMQFIPGTWARWSGDGNADGVHDPHNLYDAAAAAARYLCAGRPEVVTEARQVEALLSYNRSLPYGQAVLANGHRYRDALDLPDLAPREVPAPPA